VAEQSDTAGLYERPRHPYTAALLSASPEPDPRVERTRERITLTNAIPDPVDPPQGCRFNPRCWRATDRCRSTAPELETADDGLEHRYACFHPLQGTRSQIAHEVAT